MRPGTGGRGWVVGMVMGRVTGYTLACMAHWMNIGRCVCVWRWRGVEKGVGVGAMRTNFISQPLGEHSCAVNNTDIKRQILAGRQEGGKCGGENVIKRKKHGLGGSAWRKRGRED